VGTRKIDDDTYYQYTVAVGRDELLTVNVDDNTSIAAGNLVIFDEKTDSLYDGNVDFTVLTSSAAIAVKSYNDASKLLTYYNGTSRADANSAFDGTGSIQSTTVDDDVVIRYVNADDKKAGDEIGVNAFDGTTGFANAAIYDVDGDGLYDVIFVETSGDVNLLGNTAFGAVTTESITASDATGDNASAYSVSAPASVEVGASFTVTVSCTGINDTTNAKETVTVTYNGTAKVLTFTSASASSQSVSFTAASGQTSVTTAVVATAK